MGINLVYYCDKEYIFDPPRLDYINYYSHSVITQLDKLSLHLNTFSESLVIFITNTIGDDLLKIYNEVKTMYPNSKFMHFGRTEESIRAWDLNFFHFNPLPVTENNLQKCYNKYIQSKGTIGFIYYTDLEGVHSIPVNDIAYIQANGNYSVICISQKGKIVVSKQIKHFENMLRTDPKFIRVNRSWIINLNKIKRLDSEYLYIIGIDQPVNISKDTSAKLRKIILKLN
jgi:hypothetical protein